MTGTVHYWYRGVEYTTDDQARALAQRLAADPNEPAALIRAVFDTIHTELSWQDYKTPAEQMDRLCALLADIARERGEMFLR